MRQFPKVNWSALIRKLVKKRVHELSLKEDLLTKLKEEKELGFTDWTVQMGNKLNK